MWTPALFVCVCMYCHVCMHVYWTWQVSVGSGTVDLRLGSEMVQRSAPAAPRSTAYAQLVLAGGGLRKLQAAVAPRSTTEGTWPHSSSHLHLTIVTGKELLWYATAHEPAPCKQPRPCCRRLSSVSPPIALPHSGLPRPSPTPLPDFPPGLPALPALSVRAI